MQYMYIHKCISMQIRFLNLFLYSCTAYVKNIMTKSILQGRGISELVNLPNVFCMERHAYLKVLPVLGSFGPRCIHADKNTIIMEDLAEKGYACCERRDFLDLDHTVVALKVSVFLLIIQLFNNCSYIAI